MRMTIGTLARQAGVNVETVRYYQRRGLIPEPPRRPRGFRTYDEAALRLLRFVRRLKGLGFTLVEIAQVLRLRQEGGDAGAALDALFASKLAQLEGTVRALEATARGVRAMRAQVKLVRGEDRWRVLEQD